MGLLFLLAAILGLLFPPLAIVVLAAMVLGVFAKGVAAESPEQIVRARPKAKRRRREGRPRDVIRYYSNAPQQGDVIDVRCEAIPLPLNRSAPSCD